MAMDLGSRKCGGIDGIAPAALENLAAPDAIFIGGGLGPSVFDACLSRLRPLGRLVINAVTLESEALLLQLYAKHGGSLVKLQTQRAGGFGAVTGWKPMRTVTQYALVKR